jgi:CRISPR-associated protein Cas2
MKHKGRNVGRNISRFKGLWLICMFDLPMKTSEEKKEYRDFHKLLKKEGFTMFQLSVYGRYCMGEDHAKSPRKRIRQNVPPLGQVRIITITDHQFSKMEVFLGKSPQKVENPPEQMQLF